MHTTFFPKFIKYESASGIILLIATLLALLAANSSLFHCYQTLFNFPVIFEFSTLKLESNFLLFINDGLMCFFFLLVSLEIKREILQGELSTYTKAALPVLAALGGVLLPALIFFILNIHSPQNFAGWAIPTATDIAFSLSILSLLGKRIPRTLKIFLTTLAIIDDLSAIVIIAVFYTDHIHFLYLFGALLLVIVLLAFNFFNVSRTSFYMMVGILLWFCILKSGVHATITGVILGLNFPLQIKQHPSLSPAKKLEKNLHPWIAYLILPLFAFANAGINFSGLSLKNFFDPLTLGCMLGLFLGKPIGIYFSSWASVKTGIAQLPQHVNWQQMFGISIICGIGFTMSLFISSLAYGEYGSLQFISAKLGILVGSFGAGIAGYLWLKR